MSFADSLTQATQNGICSLIDNFSRQNELFSRIDPTGQSRFNTRFWRGLNRRVCNKEQPGEDPPIEGGQCDAVRYEVQVTFRRSTGFACNTQDNSITRTVWGAITGLTIENQTPDQPINPQWRIELICRGDGATPGEPGTVVLVAQFTNAGDSCPDPEIVDVSVNRVDGLPDECPPGFIPPPPPPPGWNNIIINNFTWINNFGDIVDEGDLNLNFGFAYLDADFDIKVPVRIDVGGLNFNGNFNFDKGAFNFDFSRDIVNNNNDNGDIIIRNPGGDNRELPRPDDNSDRPDDIDPDEDIIEDDFPDDIEQASRIIAVRVVVNQTGNFVDELFQNQNPNIAIPNYGYIQFFIQTDVTEGGWTADIPVKNKNHYIPCPVPQGALLVRGTARPGVLWSIQAFRSKLGKQISFPIGS